MLCDRGTVLLSLFYLATGRVWDNFATPQNRGFCGYGYSCCSVFFYSVCLYAKSVRRFCSEQNRLADRKKSARSGQRVAKQSQTRPDICLRILKRDRRTVRVIRYPSLAVKLYEIPCYRMVKFRKNVINIINFRTVSIYIYEIL